MRIRTIVAAVASAVCLTAVATLPAHAAFSVTQDPYKDVAPVAETGNESDSTSNKASVDINWLRLTHQNQLTFEFKIRELNPTDQVSAFVAVKTPNGDIWRLRKGWTDTDKDIKLTKNGTDRAQCADGIKAKKDPTANVITLQIKRSCLGNPDSVKFGGGLAGFTSAGAVLVDDATKDGNPPANPDNFKIGTVSVDFN